MSITATLWRKHWILERNSILLLLGILIVIAIGGLVEVVPLFYLKSTIETAPGMRPYTPLELAGRNVYVREGCYLCHSQMIRRCATRSSATGTTRSQPRASTTDRSSGAPSATDRTWHVSAANIPTTGIATI